MIFIRLLVFGALGAGGGMSGPGPCEFGIARTNFAGDASLIVTGKSPFGSLDLTGCPALTKLEKEA